MSMTFKENLKLLFLEIVHSPNCGEIGEYKVKYATGKPLCTCGVKEVHNRILDMIVQLEAAETEAKELVREVLFSTRYENITKDPVQVLVNAQLAVADKEKRNILKLVHDYFWFKCDYKTYSEVEKYVNQISTTTEVKS